MKTNNMQLRSWSGRQPKHTYRVTLNGATKHESGSPIISGDTFTFYRRQLLKNPNTFGELIFWKDGIKVRDHTQHPKPELAKS